MILNLWKAASRARTQRTDTPASAAFVYDPAMYANLGPERDLPVCTNRQRCISPIAGYSSRVPNSMHVLYSVARKLRSMSGIRYDVIPFDSLTKKSPYKLLVFGPVLGMTKARREVLTELRKGDRLMVWSWASGLLQDGKLKPNAIGEACGMAIRLSAKPSPVTMHPTGKLRGFMGGQRLFNMLGAVSSPFNSKAGLSNRFSPSFEIKDPKATILAVNSHTKRPMLAYRKFFRWQSVYCASPIINPEIVRACALKSGVHVYYSYNEPSLVTDRFILISPSSRGTRSITLPEKSPLFEVFSGMQLSAAKSQKFKVKHGRTYLFYRGSKREWQSLRAGSR